MTNPIPEKWWQHESTCRQFSQYFGEHLMGLFLAYSHPTARGHLLYTGFLYEHQGVPLWMTAGHTLRKFEDSLKTPNLKILKTEWLDTRDYSTDPGIPLDIADLNPVPVDKDGIDFGFIILKPYYARLVQAKAQIENQFLNAAAWLKNPLATDGYYLLGFPVQAHEVKTTDRTDGKTDNVLKAPIYCMPLKPVEDRVDGTPESFWQRPGAFYGKLLPFADSGKHPIDSIKFMSGGPIVAVRRDDAGQIRYFLVGIQSAWLESERIVRATGIETVSEILDELFKRFREGPPPAQ